MPKPKRRKNIWPFDGYKKTTIYHVYPKGGKGRGARAVPETDSKFDEIAKSLAGKPYKSLTAGQKATVRSVASKMNPRRKRKRNVSVGLPKNQFVNAKVRMKGGKIQVMADERILGKAGFKAGAGLKGVSVSGGAKLNPMQVGFQPKKKARFTATDRGGKKHVWHYWRDPHAKLWFLQDPDGYVRSLESDWRSSVPRIRTVLDNHDMKAKID